MTQQFVTSTGVFSTTSPQLYIKPNNPTTRDFKNISIGSFWLSKTSGNFYGLSSVVGDVATWSLLNSGSFTGIQTITGDNGGPVGPNPSFNLDFIGSGSITITGNPTNNTLTFTGTTGDVTFITDTGTPFVSAAVTISTDLANVNSGATFSFDASTPNITLNVTDGSDNTLIGLGTGNLTFTGNRNTGYGSGVLSSLTDGDDNTCLGTFSGTQITGGTDNTCVGTLSGAQITSADDNTCVGSSSLSSLVNGSANCSFGSSSGNSLISGSYNLLLGVSAGSNFTSSESSNILLNNNGILGENNVLKIGANTGSGSYELVAAYISGIQNATLTSGTPTPYLITQDISSDQLQCLTPVDAAAASTAFGSLAIGTALQNTSLYPILVNVSLDVTAATGATILVGVGDTNTPTAQAVTGAFSVTGPYSFSFVVPSQYFAEVTTSGTITVATITTLATQIG